MHLKYSSSDLVQLKHWECVWNMRTRSNRLTADAESHVSQARPLPQSKRQPTAQHGQHWSLTAWERPHSRRDRDFARSSASTKDSGSAGTGNVRLEDWVAQVWPPIMHIFITLRLSWISYCGLRIMGPKEQSISTCLLNSRIFVGIRKIPEHFRTR